MWHPIKAVAISRRVDAGALARFAQAHAEKYAVVVENGRIEVNTWYVDDLVRDFHINEQPAIKE